ncbi:hypothetical protein PGT21_012898 [Puccinia graminis f. sp. tritici]|uniref:No apical meristem-associated C-terminal domain-containing protein n=1 Tax=Puccinia graminis f. sp. tritici TaxID=56615 RepID=A0A5B0MLB4_PUCGR|nr:hypothetical protein PGT21_012898 [Puccinia graminis f. sp. tritici]
MSNLSLYDLSAQLNVVGDSSSRAEAKELYKTTLGSPFNLDHCWGILKDTPKWQATQRENEARTKKTTKSETAAPSTDASSSVVAVSSPRVVDIEDNDSEPSRSVLGNGRVEGQKAAKQKRADEALIEKIVAMQKDLVNISRERLSAMNSAKDDAIMSKDLLLMDDESRAYYQRKHRLIMARELEQEEKEKKEKEKKEKEKKEKEKKELEEKERREKEALEADDEEEEAEDEEEEAEKEDDEANGEEEDMEDNEEEEAYDEE